MILKNLLMFGHMCPVDIDVADKRITAVSDSFAGESKEGYASRPDGLALMFDHALVFPGLINSHDHLDFNLFPALGGESYNNYTEWGKYIHEHYKEEISKVLNVPLLLREEWGIFKNLICGVTTVVNHGENILIRDQLITVHERYQFIHSVRFERRWKKKLNHPFRLMKPVVIHIGEGTDAAAFLEIEQLLRCNFLSKTLIGVHGVAMTSAQAKGFNALVWCPVSNFFLLNHTADIAELKQVTEILFGTDSTLTGSWNIWEHLRLARINGGLTDTELHQSLNAVPSKVWKTNSGVIKPGYDADLVIADINGKQADMNAFFSVDPKDILLVLHQGNVRLFDASCLPQLVGLELTGFSKLYIDGVCKYVQGDIHGLINKIRTYYPEAEFPVKDSL